MDMAEEQGQTVWIPTAIGFLLGIFFLLMLDHIIPHLHLNSTKAGRNRSKVKKYYDDGFSSNTSQYSRRYGSGRCVCWSDGSKYR